MFGIFSDDLLNYLLSVIREDDVFVLSLTCRRMYRILKNRRCIKYREHMFTNMTRLEWAWNLPYFYCNDLEHQYMLSELAISSNSLETLIWLHEKQSCKWPKTIATFAMYYGNPKIIQYIISKGAPLSTRTIEVAQECNNLHVLYDAVIRYTGYEEEWSNDLLNAVITYLHNI